MLNITSQKLNDYLMWLDKKLLKSMKNNLSISFQSTTNGLLVRLNGESFTLDHTIDDFSDSDGQLTVDFLDSVDLLMGDTIHIEEVDDEIVNINRFPVFKVSSDYTGEVFNEGGSCELTDRETRGLLKRLKHYRKELKKSLLNESSYVMIDGQDDHVDLRLLNPFDYTVDPLLTEHQGGTFHLFLDKAGIKLMELFFNKGDIVLRTSFVYSDQYQLRLDPVDVNQELYYADRYLVSEM